MRVTVGIASAGPPTWPLVDSLLMLKHPVGGRWTLRRVVGLGVDVARNAIANMTLESGDDWLLMVDADAVLHPDTLVRLLSWQQPVVGALAFKRYESCEPTVYRDHEPGRPERRRVRIDEVREWLQRYPVMASYPERPVVLEPRPDDALFPIDRTGCHCVLVHRDVLEAIEPPWFQGVPPYYNREDLYFFGKVEEQGYPMWVDFSCSTTHLYGDRPAGALSFLVWDQATQFEET